MYTYHKTTQYTNIKCLFQYNVNFTHVEVYTCHVFMACLVVLLLACSLVDTLEVGSKMVSSVLADIPLVDTSLDICKTQNRQIIC